MSAPILAASDLSAAPVAAPIVVGVLVAIGGHLAGRKVAATGIAILFVDSGNPRPKCDDPVGC